MYHLTYDPRSQESAPISTRVVNYPPCLSGYRAQFDRLSTDMDVVINVGTKKPERLFMVGNGHVASTPLTGSHSVLLDSELYLVVQ